MLSGLSQVGPKALCIYNQHNSKWCVYQNTFKLEQDVLLDQKITSKKLEKEN